MTDKTNDFHPEDDLIAVSKTALKDLIEKGFAYYTFPNGQTIRITFDDLLFKKDEVDKYAKENRDKNI